MFHPLSIIWANVDLPDPFSPTTTYVCPRLIANGCGVNKVRPMYCNRWLTTSSKISPRCPISYRFRSAKVSKLLKLNMSYAVENSEAISPTIGMSHGHFHPKTCHKPQKPSQPGLPLP